MTETKETSEKWHFIPLGELCEIPDEDWEYIDEEYNEDTGVWEQIGALDDEHGALCDCCGSLATHRCGGCGTALYCGTECRDWDWYLDGHGHVCDLVAGAYKRCTDPEYLEDRIPLVALDEIGKQLQPGKASIMLHEKKWTSAKQRRFFGWVAGGRKRPKGRRRPGGRKRRRKRRKRKGRKRGRRKRRGGRRRRRKK